MQDAEIYATLTDIFRRTLDDDSIELSPDSTAETVKGWDSANHILLVVGIEEGFGVKFQAAEMEELRDVGELVAVLKAKLAKKAPR